MGARKGRKPKGTSLNDIQIMIVILSFIPSHKDTSGNENNYLAKIIERVAQGGQKESQREPKELRGQKGSAKVKQTLEILEDGKFIIKKDAPKSHRAEHLYVKTESGVTFREDLLSRDPTFNPEPYEKKEKTKK